MSKPSLTQMLGEHVGPYIGLNLEGCPVMLGRLGNGVDADIIAYAIPGSSSHTTRRFLRIYPNEKAKKDLVVWGHISTMYPIYDMTYLNGRIRILLDSSMIHKCKTYLGWVDFIPAHGRR